MLTLGTRVRAEIAKIVSRVCRRSWAMAAVIALAAPCRGGPVDGLASAIEAFKRHDHVAARDLARAAYAADGSADALELWALSSLRLGEIPRASALYGELADLPGAPPSVKKRAESQLSALRRQGARLTVTLTPAGANLTIDGNIVGTSPLAYEFALLPGKHQIRASLEGYTGREAEWVAKPGGRLAVEWALEAKNVGPAPMAVVSAPPTEPPAATPSPELRAVIPVRPEPVTTPPENAISAPAVATRALRLVELRGGVRRVARRVEQEGEKLRLLAEDGSELVVDTSELVGLSILDDELVAGFGTRVSHALENLDLAEAPRLIRLANGRVAAVLESAKTGARAQVVDVSSGLPVEPQAVVGALELGAAAVNVVSLKDGAQVVGQFLERTRSGKLAFQQLHGQVILLETETIERIAALRPAERVLLQDGTTLVGKILERDSSSILVSLPNGNQVRRSAREVAEARLSRWARGLGIDPDSVSLSVTKHGFEARIRLDEAEAKRRAWMDRGGVLPTFAVHATGVGILMPSTGGVCSTPNGGGGGGGGGRLGLVYLGLPDVPSTAWFATRFATGADVSALGMSYGFPAFSFGGDIQCLRTTFVQTQVSVPFTTSVQIGLGAPDLAGSWSGVVLGLGWSPSLSITIPEAGPAQTEFVSTGFEVSLDFATLEGALEGMAAEAHFRIAGFVLPPTSSNGPWVGSLTLGAVWY